MSDSRSGQNSEHFLRVVGLFGHGRYLLSFVSGGISTDKIDKIAETMGPFLIILINLIGGIYG